LGFVETQRRPALPKRGEGLEVWNRLGEVVEQIAERPVAELERQTPSPPTRAGPVA